MGEFKVVISEIEGEEKIIEAANYLLSALGPDKNLSRDARKVLSDLLSQLSRVVTFDDGNGGKEINEFEEQLNAISEKITSWEATGQNEAYDYLNSVNEVTSLIEWLERTHRSSKNDEELLLRKAHDVLQIVMARLEEEFRHLIVQNQLPFEPVEQVSFRSTEEDVVVDEGSVNSFSFSSVEDSLHRYSVCRTSGEIIIDLVDPDVIPDLKSIANAMFMAKYDRECTQAYTMARKDAFDEFLFSYEMEKMSIEDVLKLDWTTLNSNIKKWVRVMRNVVRVYLASEKWLSNQILGDQGSVSLTCFVEASKASMMQLINFGEAVSITPRQPEKLYRILDMYEVVAYLLPDVDALFTGDAGSAIRTEYQQLMKRLGDCVTSTFLEFKNAIASDASANPFPGGAVHRLASYVMNYLIGLTDYSETLEVLLNEHDIDDLKPPSPNIYPVIEEEDTDENSPSGKFPAMTRHFHSVTLVLETNLLEKSRLYRDVALQHFFLMNNVFYMAQKAMNLELQHIFGNKWIRQHNGKFQHHAREYERATWNSILLLLKDEGAGSSSRSRSQNPRDRLQNFFTAFEEVYKTQTAWVISNPQLREDLRISASPKVILAYRTFCSRHRNQVSDRHIKYSEDDLERCLLDLFAGSQKSLNGSYRR